MSKHNIISFSGGKDSTAMALEMLERGEEIHSVVAFDTGWEFPQMFDHWDKFEKYTGLEIIKLYPKKPFDYWMFDRPVKKRGSDIVYQYGNGWPSAMRRWCTREKVKELRGYLKTIPNHISCIGFASDEAHRAGLNSTEKYPQRYPLIEYGIDEKQALVICKKHGFDWGGLYDHFSRVSCFCCPLQRIGALRILRREYPDLWQTMIDWDKRCNGNNPGFYGYKSVMDLDRRFAEEDKQMSLQLN